MVSSRRSSSRKSSRKSTKNTNTKNDNMETKYFTTTTTSGKTVSVNKNNLPKSIILALLLITILIQSSILYYLYILEDVDCNCIRDWRHNFIKGFSVLVIFLGLLGVAFNFNLKNYKWINLVYTLISFVNLYAFITYVGELNATKCACAVSKHPNINSLMQIYRWVYIVVLALGIIALILALFTGFNMH